VVALTRLGRVAEARGLADRELMQAIGSDGPRRHGMALSVCGTLDRSEAGLATLRDAITILEASPARLEHARGLVHLGAGLLERGDRERAREVLSDALDRAHGLGAVALAEQARAELIASGARPRRDALSGPEALTPAELRSARMAADGLTNREIAQALFVSTRTVEAQLSQAYAKLAIGGRGELGPALAHEAGSRPNFK
jgi:DNA-binding CsgD family transcriptional regulator